MAFSVLFVLFSIVSTAFTLEFSTASWCLLKFLEWRLSGFQQPLLKLCICIPLEVEECLVVSFEPLPR